MNFCDECQTCAHCLKKGCVPVQPATKEPRMKLTTWLKGLYAAWRERRDIRRRYKEFDAGFEYALSALRDPVADFRPQLQEQADSSPDNPFCLGMQIALKGWKS